MRVQPIPASAYRVMPWKNGKGSTTELCIGPPEASVQNGFDWRISVAQVPESGPFSNFPQYERTIMLLRGAPMRLVHEGRGEHILQPFQPYAFSGAWNTTGILTGDAVVDFNVMIREGFGHAGVQVYRGTEKSDCILPHASVQYVWACQGRAEILFGEQVHELAEEASCLIENGSDLLLRLRSSAAIVIAVNIQLAGR